MLMSLGIASLSLFMSAIAGPDLYSRQTANTSALCNGTVSVNTTSMISCASILNTTATCIESGGDQSLSCFCTLYNAVLGQCLQNCAYTSPNGLALGSYLVPTCSLYIQGQDSEAMSCFDSGDQSSASCQGTNSSTSTTMSSSSSSTSTSSSSSSTSTSASGTSSIPTPTQSADSAERIKVGIFASGIPLLVLACALL